MQRLTAVNSFNDIFQEYQGTAIELLLEYHNLGKPFEINSNAQMLIGMCMDNRKYLNIPENFAYIIRTGGANLRYSEFKISYSIAVGGIQTIALIGHDRCGMVNLHFQKDRFVRGLIENAGWDRKRAEQHFEHFAPMFEIGNEIDFVLSESKRLRTRYPKILVVPMFYLIDDNRLYLVKE